MKALTIRNVPPSVVRALEAEKRRRGASLNHTIIDLLSQSLGVRPAVRSNGLRSLAGTWSEQDLSRFERDTAIFEEIDQDLWS